MSANLYKTLSSAFAAEVKTPEKKLKSSGFRSSLAPPPTVLLSAYPITLNSEDYKNPLSTANPNGDLISLWRFRQLVDPIPQFADVYIPGSSSTERTYTQIIKGAVAEDADSFAADIIGDAVRNLTRQTFANMDGTPGSWCPVYAVPDNWYDSKAFNGIKQLDIDLGGITGEKNGAGNAPEDQTEWKIVNPDNSTSTIPLHTGSKISSAKVSYQMVSLSRPWFDPLLFETSGWYLKGQNEGFCSSGKNDGRGVLPMIPSSVIIGTNVEILAEWSRQDLRVINNAKEENQQLSLGPLLVNAGQNDIQLHVIGWVMTQIPYSPQIKK
ncbi:hypothetical protein [Adhaeribacter soli]|uniref:Uncharacterized protein n=1 Tax=Adhaeribacter soli TaxID=2607655 RepID=A0A5N1J0U6_9BACT|nr:hypothetical protein [Adhaeribacter soli]KAA9340260.1 hypothetical protein F0P94_07900 [Adhaeribacter soli]